MLLNWNAEKLNNNVFKLVTLLSTGEGEGWGGIESRKGSLSCGEGGGRGLEDKYHKTLSFRNNCYMFFYFSCLNGFVQDMKRSSKQVVFYEKTCIFTAWN